MRVRSKRKLKGHCFPFAANFAILEIILCCWDVFSSVLCFLLGNNNPPPDFPHFVLLFSFPTTQSCCSFPLTTIFILIKCSTLGHGTSRWYNNKLSKVGDDHYHASLLVKQGPRIIHCFCTLQLQLDFSFLLLFLQESQRPSWRRRTMKLWLRLQ